VAIGEIDDELVEVSVANYDEFWSSAVQVAALACEGEQRRVDE
jgi:hypothetical protein